MDTRHAGRKPALSFTVSPLRVDKNARHKARRRKDHPAVRPALLLLFVGSHSRAAAITPASTNLGELLVRSRFFVEASPGGSSAASRPAVQRCACRPRTRRSRSAPTLGGRDQAASITGSSPFLPAPRPRRPVLLALHFLPPGLKPACSAICCGRSAMPSRLFEGGRKASAGFRSRGGLRHPGQRRINFDSRAAGRGSGPEQSLSRESNMVNLAMARCVAGNDFRRRAEMENLVRCCKRGVTRY